MKRRRRRDEQRAGKGSGALAKLGLSAGTGCGFAGEKEVGGGRASSRGPDAASLQSLLGHASLETNRRYLDASAEGLRHVVRGHPGQAALREHLRERRAEDT